MIMPVLSIHGLPIGGLNGLPMLPLSQDFGFLEPVNGLGECVVIAVFHAAHSGVNPGLKQSVAVVNRCIDSALSSQARPLKHRLAGVFIWSAC